MMSEYANDLLGTVTENKLWIAYTKKHDAISLRTPNNRRIQLLDMKDNEEIRIEFNKETSIVLDSNGITIKAKQINLESDNGIVKINKAEFKR